ncbi:hypothetical protein Prum_051330 [Phytohabitans rumicis]|uniref:Aminotransferase class III n=1 Tax=Phytohabitans rumicis TaxID=1076125 RepID=A0A6V8L9K8_9ACTN|nr:hypothetical protein Prum_051330 [Phytohabitans rumicis]
MRRRPPHRVSHAPRLHALAERDPRIGDVRGRGAMLAIETAAADPTLAGAVSRACHSAGLLTLTCGTYGNVLRFLPPLVIDDATLTRGLDILDEAFTTI